MKKSFSIILLLLALCGSSLATVVQGFSLIVVPARYSVLQVMFDVINQRQSVLVSYQGEASTAEPLLHVWNGSSWNPISLHDLREMSFVQKTPTRAILVGNDELLPTSIQDAVSWMPEVVVIRQLENSSLLNELGRVLKWKKNEWRWFSARYNLQLEDEAAAERNSSWYDQPGPLLKKDQPRYEPVPYIHEDAAPDSSSTIQSDVQSTGSADVITEEPEYKDDDIKDLVDTLEKSKTAEPAK